MKLDIYQWLEKHFVIFLLELGWDQNNAEHYSGLILAHGDKTRQYEKLWIDHGIPYEEGTVVYLLTHIPPYSLEVRKVVDGKWVPPQQWVIDNFKKFETQLSLAKQKVEV